MIIVYLVLRQEAKGEQDPNQAKPYALPITPQEIRLETEQRTDEFSLRTGSVMIPRGMRPQGISFDAFFPFGPDDPDFIVETSRPFLSTQAWVNLLRKWMQDKAPLSINITESPINLPVFIEKFTPSWSGGMGHVPYSITFREQRDTEIKPYSSTKQGKTVAKTRVPVLTVKNYVVKAGDTLMLISKKTLGDATRYKEILALNSALIPNPGSVTPGLKLRVPNG